MSEASLPLEAAPLEATIPRDRRLRLGLQFGRLLRAGELGVEFPDGERHRFVGAAPGPAATLIVRDPRMVMRMALGGSLGLAESYIDGQWDSPDLAAMLLLGTANEASWDALISGKPWIRALSRLLHALRPNTRAGARRNIAEHYDLGNDFYALWLDAGMTYSAAMFERPGQGLADAQDAKIRRLCRELGLAPGMRVLEIGCGWGGFAECAAREFGVTVHGVTLSREQLAHARARIRDAGLADRVTLALQDYRDIAGQFDRIVSVEMIEAVGEAYWPVYFRTLRDRLRPGGLAGVQAITIADRYFESYRRSADFIQRHVFPGGMLLSPSRLRMEAARAGLIPRGEHWFGLDYAETLKRWQANFQAAWPRIARLPAAKCAYDTRFKRLWEFYLAYCEAGFRAGWTDVGQIVIARE